MQDFEATTEATYNILKDDYEWEWPNLETYLESFPGFRETVNSFFAEDMGSEITSNPRVAQERGEEAARWFRCALIVCRALAFLQHCRNEADPEDQEWKIVLSEFNPRMYFDRITLCQEMGGATFRRVFEEGMPSDPLANGDWFVQRAQQMVMRTINAWGFGIDPAYLARRIIADFTTSKGRTVGRITPMCPISRFPIVFLLFHCS